MTLRRRLALTILVTAVPLVLAILWFRGHIERGSLTHGLREFVLTHMESGGRELCEQDPARFPPGPRPRRRGPPRRGPGLDGPPLRERHEPRRDHQRGHDGPRPHRRDQARFWAYRPDFVSDSRRAPEFPAELRAALEAGDDTASVIVEGDNGPVIHVGARMPWATGPCAIMLVAKRIEDRSEERTAILWSLVAVCLLLLGAALFAAGPIVRRARRLQREVRRSAGDRYATPIDMKGSDELAQLAHAFNDAGQEVRGQLEELEARERTLRRFVADTTHDVMIPLTVLQGHLDAIQKLGKDADPGLVRLALEESHYLGSLMHNLGAAAKLEGGEVQVQTHPVDLRALVERVAARHEPVARMRGIGLAFAVPDDEVTAPGDVTLLEQAVSNIVHNAVRYNTDGGHVSVLLERAPDKDKRGFVLTVTDDGPGVSDEQLQRLTERSYRAEGARTRDPNGSGIGLHIARDVAQRHGLALTFAHANGGGLEVVLRGGDQPA